MNVKKKVKKVKLNLEDLCVSNFGNVQIVLSTLKI